MHLHGCVWNTEEVTQIGCINLGREVMRNGEKLGFNTFGIISFFLLKYKNRVYPQSC